MQQDFIDAVQQHPRYQELICSRRCFAWNLTALMLVMYYGFILVIAFGRNYSVLRLLPER